MGEITPALRRATSDDVEALLHLWQEADAVAGVTDNADDVRNVIGADCACALVMETEGRLIGSVIGTFDGWRGNIYRLAVLPEYRRRGIARSLLAAVERWLAERGAKRITALVVRAHPWAVGFWDASDYVFDERTVRYVHTL